MKGLFIPGLQQRKRLLIAIRKRQQSKATGLELLKLGQSSAAYMEFQKAIDVTPTMARQVIDACRAIGVQCLVAPYEADSQLYYLEKIGIIDGVVSEDSDLLVFGVKSLITKLDQYGECFEVNRDDFTKCKDVSLAGWTQTEFRHMCILSGCDYLDSIPTMGLKTAHRLIRRHKDVEKVLRVIRFEGKKSIPRGYIENFKRADMTFQHQRVFCPLQEQIVMANEPEPGTVIDDETLVYIGLEVVVGIARGVARGDLDPMTKEPIKVPPPPPPNQFMKAWGGSSQPTTPTTPSNNMTITSFFKRQNDPARTPLQSKDINKIAQINCLSAPARTISTPMPKRGLSTTAYSENKRPRIAPSTVDHKSIASEKPVVSPYFRKPVARHLVTPTPATKAPVGDKLRRLQAPDAQPHSQLSKDAGKILVPGSPSKTKSAESPAKSPYYQTKSPFFSTPSRRSQTTPATTKSQGSFFGAEKSPSSDPVEDDSDSIPESPPSQGNDSTKEVVKGWKERYTFNPESKGTTKLSEIIEKQAKGPARKPVTPLQHLSAKTLSNTSRPTGLQKTKSTPTMRRLSQASSSSRSTAYSQQSQNEWPEFVGTASSSQTSIGTASSQDDVKVKGLFDRFAYVGK